MNLCTGIFLGKGTKIVGPIIIGKCSTLTIGADCWIGMDKKVYGNGFVTIGDRYDIAAFYTGSHEIGDNQRRAGQGLMYSKSVGDACWLGARCSIIGNITIDNASVIGANSLVNKDVVADTMVAGIPAKLMRRLT